jgi:hypothetical protein
MRTVESKINWKGYWVYDKYMCVYILHIMNPGTKKLIPTNLTATIAQVMENTC